MRIIFATGNAGKMREIREIMADMDMEICSMKEAGISLDIEENGTTFEENAQIKAKAVAACTKDIVLADDSGLEVDYLNKEPGVYSARYLGEDTSPSAFRYAVRYEGHTDLAPYEFFECCNEKSDDEILGAAVQHYDVVEIDDGIKPAFFYKTEHGYELLFSFDAKIAKKNIREEID